MKIDTAAKVSAPEKIHDLPLFVAEIKVDESTDRP